MTSAAGPERTRPPGSPAATSQGRFLLTDEGRALREAAEASRSARAPASSPGSPWEAIATAADAAGEDRGRRRSHALRGVEAEEAERTGPAARRRAREAEETAKRASRRARTETLDLGLALLGAWMRDLAAAAEGARRSRARRRPHRRSRAPGVRGSTAPRAPRGRARARHAPPPRGERLGDAGA